MNFLALFKIKKIRPFHQDFLTVGDGHHIHFMQVGNPAGQPVLVFHGGPGGALNINKALQFDLKKHRVILFSQRGCGKSIFDDLLKNNTTNQTIDDAIALLNHLNIKEKIILSGASYGATLALLTAQKYPKRVKSLCLTAIFLARPIDTKWAFGDSARFYPDLMDMLKEKAGTENIFAYYHQKINSEKYKDIQQALQYYGSYEYALGNLNPSFDKVPAITDAMINSLKISMHYDKNNMFMTENEILDNVDKIKHIPMIITHNRLDMVCPVDQAYLLHKACPKSRLIINPDIGHMSASLKQKSTKEFVGFLKK